MKKSLQQILPFPSLLGFPLPLLKAIWKTILLVAFVIWSLALQRVISTNTFSIKLVQGWLATNICKGMIGNIFFGFSLKNFVSVGSKIMDEIFETNSSFHEIYVTTRTVQFLFFKSFLLVLTKSLLGEENLALGYNPKVWHFPNIF